MSPPFERGNPLVSGRVPSQRVSNAESISMSWCHYDSHVVWTSCHLKALATWLFGELVQANNKRNIKLLPIQVQTRMVPSGPISLTNFACSRNVMKISFCCNSFPGLQTTTNFRTCHESYAVVSCAKNCGRISIKAKCNLPHIWIVMKRLLVRWILETLLLT